jgi:aminoglycoside phosphotransferase (APT) family kinase protein
LFCGAVKLDDDIAAALRALRMTPRSARRVTGTPAARSDRAAFRVVLTDGRTVKARRLSRAAVARRYVALARSLRALPLPAILARSGRITIETWISGTPLDALACTPGRARAAGALLAAIHRTGARHGPPSAPTRPFLDDLLRRLDALARLDALRPAEIRALGRALAVHRPSRARTGLTHNDFCAENLVEDGDGRMYVVDNGGLRPGFLDFDLARAWYRWPMSATGRRAFLTGYGGWRRDPEGGRARVFWRVAAIVRSAHFRVVRATRDVDVPLRRLRALARGDVARFDSSRR